MSTRVTLFVLALAATTVPRNARALPSAEVVGVSSGSTALLRSLVPGLAQLDGDHRLRGWTMIAAEGTFLAAALGFQLAGDAARRESAADFSAAATRDGAYAAGRRLALDAAQRTRFRDGFLVAAASAWVLSLVDARLTRAYAAAAAVADEPVGREPDLMPIASISRRGLVAGLSLKF